MNDALRLKIDTLPDSPGCYLMKHEGEIIYVGKAKNLKNRVRQYFHDSRDHTVKVRAMVNHIDDFDIVLVDGELEALILENNLIKRHKPRYNILLKDDKAYPYIRVALHEDYPRVELARRAQKDGARYFGPYMSATVVRETLDVIRQVFPVRTCSRAINPDKPTRPCVQYEIGRCLAPCANKTTPEAYNDVIRQVLGFLEGDDKPIMEALNKAMREASAAMNFERAALYRDRLRAVEAVSQKQKAMVTGGGDQDIIAAVARGDEGIVSVITVRAGRMIASDNHILQNAEDESPGDMLTSFMLQYYAEDALPPREIILSAPIEDAEALSALLSERRGGRVTLTRPQRGEKKRLTDMAMKNAFDAADKRFKQRYAAQARTVGALEELRRALNLDKAPRRIEGYDISNTQGAQSVASMVVMIDGEAAHRSYRHFRIKTVEGADDFASIEEVITRRLSHGLKEREERLSQGLDAEGGSFSDLPDLILIDGGHGQLERAVAARDALGLSMPMFGLAKRLEEIVLPNEETSILLDRHSPALHLIQRLRDEAHRFAIEHHRKLRGKAAIQSRLDDIPGVGPARKKALIRHFRSMDAVMKATEEELCQTEGISKGLAKVIYEALHNQTDETSHA